MRYLISFIIFIGVSLALPGLTAAQAKSAGSIPSTPVSPALDDILSPKAAAARKTAIQNQLDRLEQSNLPKEERDKAKVALDELLQLLDALADARQRHATYTEQLNTLPKQLEELSVTLTTLESRDPGQFPNPTESLRDQYDAQLHAVQVEIQDLTQQNSEAETRLAQLPPALEKRFEDRPKLQQRLRDAQRQLPVSDPLSRLRSERSRVEIQLQLLLTEIQMLDAERKWLLQRGVLHDAQMRVAQAKRNRLRQDLSAITAALGNAFEQTQTAIDKQLSEFERALKTAVDPLETLQLTVQLETAQIRRETANDRLDRNRLNEELLAQERRTVQERIDADRIAALFEKYANGESGGEWLLITFERLRRERNRFRDNLAKTKEIKQRLRTFTDQLYKTEDRLYNHERQVDARLAGLLQQEQAALPPLLRQAFDDQKTALREQQQLLAAITQTYATLLSLHREYRQLLDDSYYTALSKILWLRDAERVNLSMVRQIVGTPAAALGQLQEALQAEYTRVNKALVGAVHLWVFAAFLLVGAPWAAYKIDVYLRELVQAQLTRCAERDLPCGLFDALFIVMRAAVWPAYLWLLGWSRTLFTPRDMVVSSSPLVEGLCISALILFVALLGRDILRAKGWARQFWGWPPGLCKFLYRIVIIGCLAALILLVPRSFLLAVPGQREAAAGSLALARFLMLSFQSTVLVLVAIAGWRQNPLMEHILARSHQSEGLLWRLWPIIYLIILTGLVGIIALDLLGYRYAARFIWFRSLESFSVLLAWRLLMALLFVRLLHHLVTFMARLWSRGKSERAAAPFDQLFRVLYAIGNTALAIVAGGAILEIWGVSVSWFLRSPLGGEVIQRVVVIALTIGLMVLVMQISRVITEYLVQPRTTPDGAVIQPNRKFRTMVPLIHTLVKFGVVFSAVIIILQQLNVAIGPILTGVGIFGLAVGFASQSLIKDVINGLFLLFEDSLSVGDIVRLRDIAGEVEKVTLRAVTIRDLEGNVHVIPNGTLDLITNMTKVFSRQVIDVGVAYREDVDTVIELLREVSEELRNDPVFGWDMMEPLEIMGVHDFSESAVVIRTRIRTLPGKQWRLGRELRKRIKRAFDEHGIEIPFPHRTIYWGAPKEHPQPPIQTSLDPPPPSQRADKGISRQAERQPPPIIED